MNVVLDTNVIISAFATRGLCAEVFEVCLEDHAIISSEYILLEVEEKLFKKLHLPQTIIQSIIEFLRDVSEIVEPYEIDMPSFRDKDDIKIIGTGLSGGARFIITGDGALLGLRKFKGVEMVTPREFWKQLKV